MIELKKLSKCFGKQQVLKNINLTFPRYGLVAICGPSGCGKTTLLNIISALTDFEGEVSFNGKQYRLMNDNELTELRNIKMGFVFQDYKLFEFETVQSNLMLALNTKSTDSKEAKLRRVKDLLKIVDLSHKEKRVVAKLSSGEKQRVAIARALANSPSLVLADEPTGNLDEVNSELIMKLLERISKSSLVVMVSHDETLVKKYADQIVRLKDGKIEKVEFVNKRKHIDVLPLAKIRVKESKTRLPISFCLSHTFNSVKRRKWRTMIVFLSTSLGLLGVGLGTVISSIVSKNLYQSYSSILDANKVVMKNKEEKENVSPYITSLGEYEVDDLYQTYYDDISGQGYYYWNDFNTMFPQYGYSLELPGSKKALPFLTLNHFNEFDLIKNNTEVIYPSQLVNVANNEVVLGMNHALLNEICFQLQIERTTNALSKYMNKNGLMLNVSLANPTWGFDTEFQLHIAGFILGKQNIFYHSNQKWNEYIFEDLLHLPTTEYINTNSKHPWDLKKSTYFEFSKNRDEFIKDLRFARDYKDIALEILDEKYYPILYKEAATFECNRVALLNKESNDSIPPYYGEFIKYTSKDIHHLIYGSQAGYAIYPDNLMMGFSRLSFLASDLLELEDVCDVAGYLKYEQSMNINVPDYMLEGHFTKSTSNGFSFEPNYQLVSGREPMNYGEIVISKAAVSQMGLTNVINQSIYLAFPFKEELLPNSYLQRRYKIVDLKVVGISDSEKLCISHDESWSLLFFQVQMGLSVFDLGVSYIAMDVNEGKEEEVITKLERAFPKFESSWPLNSVKDSIETVCDYIEKLLLIISLTSVVIASLILYLCNYLHFVEIKKDIGLVRCLGVNKKESAKFIYTHSFFMGGLSFLFASFQLVVVCFAISKSFASIFDIKSRFIFDPLALLYMFLLSFFISLVSSLLTKKNIHSLDPLSCLR